MWPQTVGFFFRLCGALRLCVPRVAPNTTEAVPSPPQVLLQLPHGVRVRVSLPSPAPGGGALAFANQWLQLQVNRERPLHFSPEKLQGLAGTSSGPWVDLDIHGRDSGEVLRLRARWCCDADRLAAVGAPKPVWSDETRAVTLCPPPAPAFGPVVLGVTDSTANLLLPNPGTTSIPLSSNLEVDFVAVQAATGGRQGPVTSARAIVHLAQPGAGSSIVPHTITGLLPCTEYRVRFRCQPQVHAPSEELGWSPATSLRTTNAPPSDDIRPGPVMGSRRGTMCGVVQVCRIEWRGTGALEWTVPPSLRKSRAQKQATQALSPQAPATSCFAHSSPLPRIEFKRRCPV
jgi:hypothetical protein